MKKILYILSIFATVLLFDSCTKERVELVGDFDPFAEDESQIRGLNDNECCNGGIFDPDEDDDDLDEDDDQIFDPDEDDDDMDEDDEDEAIDSREEHGEQG